MQQKIKLYQQGQGQALTLIHGWGMNSAVFEPITQLLADDFTVYRVDLPGHGLSGWSNQFDFEQQLDRLTSKIPPSTLLGWSMGGLYALQLVHRYPDKFSKLILVSSNPCFVQREDWLTAVAESVFTEFSAELVANWQTTIKRFLGLQMFGVDSARSLIRQISALLLSGGEPDPDAMKAGLDLLVSMDARNILADIHVPVMAVLGQRDKLVPVQLAQQLPLINPSIRVECLARSAHAPFLSHSHLFAELIREFVKPTTTG